MRTQFSDHYKDAKRKIIRRLQPAEIYLGKGKSYEASLFLRLSFISEAFAQIAILHFACLHFRPLSDRCQYLFGSLILMCGFKLMFLMCGLKIVILMSVSPLRVIGNPEKPGIRF